VDRAAPWLREVGGDDAGTRHEAAVIARVALSYQDAKADIAHDEEYEAVFFPISERLDASEAIAVDYDDRDLRTEVPDGIIYRLPDAPIGRAAWFTGIERSLVDHLTRSQALELPANTTLKLWARIDESAETFAERCHRRARDEADHEVAGLRDKYEQRALKLRDQIEAAEDQAEVLAEQARGRRNSELLSTAGSILGGILGGRKSAGAILGSTLGKAGTAAGRRGTTAASHKRTEAAENKVGRLTEDLERLETELATEVEAISERWEAAAGDITTAAIKLRKADVRVTQICLAWIPVR
jgi:predicted ribosome quality control (RQC) complex YloA/Tae2 family protein